MNLGNLRAILHQGVDAWLATGRRSGASRSTSICCFDELGDKLPRADAVKHLSLVIEAVVENYAEYRDYNSTTTQSDRGELLYMLLDFLAAARALRPRGLAPEAGAARPSILARRGRSDAAEMWRRSLAERTSELADTLQTPLRRAAQEVCHAAAHGHRPPGRAVRPPAGDRSGGPWSSRPWTKCGRTSRRFRFRLLQEETEELAQEPTGVGLDVPAWLQELEEEVEDAAWGTAHPGQSEDEVQRHVTANQRQPSPDFHSVAPSGRYIVGRTRWQFPRPASRC